MRIQREYVHYWANISSTLLENCNYKQNTENATDSLQSRRQVLNLITSKKLRNKVNYKELKKQKTEIWWKANP